MAPFPSTGAKRTADSVPDPSLDVELDNVGVVELVVAFDRLPFEDPIAPDLGELERLLEVAVDLPGEVQYGAADRNGERLGPIGRLAGQFGVNSHDAQ